MNNYEVNLVLRSFFEMYEKNEEGKIPLNILKAFYSSEYHGLMNAFFQESIIKNIIRTNFI